MIQTQITKNMTATYKLIPVLLAFSSPFASGSSVIFQFGGVIQTSSFNAPTYPLAWTNAGGVVGQTINITYVFESSTLNTGGIPNQGLYLNSVSSATVAFNGYQSTFTPSSSRIDVGNNVGGSPSDYDYLNVDGVPNAAFFTIMLLDATATAFSNIALPTNLNLLDFPTQAQGQLDGPGGIFSPTMRYSITSFAVIPEPGTLTLAGGSALFMLRRRREHTSNRWTNS